MIVTLDPRNTDRPHSLEHHRPDLFTTDRQVDLQWSYAAQPGGWSVPPTPIPEPATWLMFSLGMALLLWVTKRKVPQPRIGN